MKLVTTKVVILIVLVLLSSVFMRRSSAQFECYPEDINTSSPTPTPTPGCYDINYVRYVTYCPPGANTCCEDTYLITEHWCNNQLVGEESQHFYHYCWEI